MWWSQRGHKLRHNMAHTRCMLDKQGYLHSRACTRPRPRAWTPTRARTCRQIYNTYCFSTTTMIRERTSLLRYTYIACLIRYQMWRTRSRDREAGVIPWIYCAVFLVPFFICLSIYSFEPTIPLSKPSYFFNSLFILFYSTPLNF